MKQITMMETKPVVDDLDRGDINDSLKIRNRDSDDEESVNTTHQFSNSSNTETLSHHITNFSISEILKPSFGQTRKPASKCLTNGIPTERQSYFTDDGYSIKTEHEEKDSECNYSSQSLLFDFRCFTNKSNVVDMGHLQHIDAKGTPKVCVKPLRQTVEQNYSTFSTHSVVSADGLKYFRARERDTASSGKAHMRAKVLEKTSMEPMTSSKSKASLQPKSRMPNYWPAWVYCTRYSDRPSSGPRSRKVTRDRKRLDEKRPRTAFTNEQLMRLKEEFDVCKYLTEQRRRYLAKSLDLSEAQIKIWYQNKRAKIKKADGNKLSSLALHLMAQGLYNHKTCVINTKRDSSN